MKDNKTFLYSILAIIISVVLISFPLTSIRAVNTDCSSGYEWIPSSGVGCVQKDCNGVPSAHWGYTQNCVCGSSGSEWENPNDANGECYRSENYTSCPRCVYACVHSNESCPVDTVTSKPQPTCATECQKLIRQDQTGKVTKQSGTYPSCSCLVDINNETGQLIKTIKQEGDQRTIYTFDPSSGVLISKEIISIEAEREKIRRQLGFRYTRQQIDSLLQGEAINSFFNERMQGIETVTSRLSPNFWWQHLVALLDHGFESDADFVNTNHYGRCGDSMQWLEQQLVDKLGLNGDEGVKQEAFLSITGEKYQNLLNHTALLIRPSGIENEDWAEMIRLLVAKSGKEGLNMKDLENINPQLLQAKVFDPYYRKITSVEEFIKGWSVIRIS